MVEGAPGKGEATVTVTFTDYDLTAPTYLPAAGSGDFCSPNGTRTVYTCTLAERQIARFHVSGFNFRERGWIDVVATQDGVASEPVRITVDLFTLPKPPSAKR